MAVSKAEMIAYANEVPAGTNEREARMIAGAFGITAQRPMSWVVQQAEDLLEVVSQSPGARLITTRASSKKYSAKDMAVQLTVSFDADSVDTDDRLDIIDGVMISIGQMSLGEQFITDARVDMIPTDGGRDRTLYLNGGQKQATSSLDNWFSIDDIRHDYLSDGVEFEYGNIRSFSMTTALVPSGAGKRKRETARGGIEDIVANSRSLYDCGTTVGKQDCASRALAFLYIKAKGNRLLSDNGKIVLSEYAVRNMLKPKCSTLPKESIHLLMAAGINPSEPCPAVSLHQFCEPTGLGLNSRIRVWEYSKDSFKAVSVTDDLTETSEDVGENDNVLIARGRNTGDLFPQPTMNRPTEWYNLLLHEGHYYAILKPHILVKRQKYCDDCEGGLGKGFTKESRHKCVAKCEHCDSKACKQTAPPEGELMLVCPDCNLDFFDEECIRLHKLVPQTGANKGQSRCERYYMCLDPACDGAIISTTKLGREMKFGDEGKPIFTKVKHVHGHTVFCRSCLQLGHPEEHTCKTPTRIQQKWCRTCREWKLQGHLCGKELRAFIKKQRKLVNAEHKGDVPIDPKTGHAHGYTELCPHCQVVIDPATHQCFIRTPVGKFSNNYQLKGIDPVPLEGSYYLFDFETRPSVDGVPGSPHIVNCWVVKSMNGGTVAHGWDIESFMVQMMSRFGKPHSHKVYIAHNSQGFDSQFIMKELLRLCSINANSPSSRMDSLLGKEAEDEKEYMDLTPADLLRLATHKYIKRGSKMPFISLTLEHKEDFMKINAFDREAYLEYHKELKEMHMGFQASIGINIIDSCNFLPMSLKSFGGTFGLNITKGEFPYLFASEKNETYLGPVPDLKYFDVKRRSKADLHELVGWWVGEVHRTVSDPFQVDAMITSNYEAYGLTEQEYPIDEHALPYTGPWVFREEMLKYCKLDVDVLLQGCRAFRNVMLNLDDKPKGKNMVKGIDPFAHVTIASMCMSLYLHKFYVDRTIGNFSKHFETWARRAFHGGRTEVKKLWFKCQLQQWLEYVDFTSLYPWCNKYARYVVGFPEIFTSVDEIKNEFLRGVVARHGMSTLASLVKRISGERCYALVECDFQAPAGCMIPNLSAKSPNGKLVFDCLPHKNEVVTLLELRTALRKGYEVSRVHKIAYWPPNQVVKGMFAEYVNLFLKKKQEASGWPEWCKTEEQKEEYINKFLADNQVALDKEAIAFNPGRRATAKLCLNALWGKWVQRSNLQQKQLFTHHQVKDYHRLMLDKTIIASQKIQPDGQSVEVTYKKKDEFAELAKNTNIMIGICTTAAARERLQEHMDMLHPDQVVYMDTDSIIYVADPLNKDFTTLELGDNLGALTNEIDKVLKKHPDAKIKEVVCAGPKNYAYRIEWATGSKTHVKIKGFSLGGGHLDDDATTKKLTLESMRNIVINAGLKGEQMEGITTMDRRFLRKTGFNVSIDNRVKRTYQYVFDKSIVDAPTSYVADDLSYGWINTVPFGYYEDNRSLDLASAYRVRRSTPQARPPASLMQDLWDMEDEEEDIATGVVEYVDAYSPKQRPLKKRRSSPSLSPTKAMQRLESLVPNPFLDLMEEEEEEEQELTGDPFLDN